MNGEFAPVEVGLFLFVFALSPLDETVEPVEEVEFDFDITCDDDEMADLYNETMDELKGFEPTKGGS